MAADHQIPQTISVGPWGGDGGDSWDDMVNAGIRQIKLKMDGDWIHSINIEYDSNGVFFWLKHGGKGGNKTYAIELDYPKERITSINGHYSTYVKPDTVEPDTDTVKPDTDTVQPGTYVKSLTFKSNLKKIYGPCGVEDGTYFSFSMAEGKIVGFHGRSKDYLNCIGVHISNLQAPTILKNLVGPWGGKGGNSWDDEVNANNANISQIILAHGSLIDSIKIEYKREKVSVWSRHGGPGGNHVDKIELDLKNKERITSISGHYDTYVRSLTFESESNMSNVKKIYGPYGVEDGTCFSFSMAEGEIVGFRGRSGWYLDCIGVIPKSLNYKLFDTPLGGEGGDLWDDGVYSGIHQIIVVYNKDAIDSIHIEYDNNGSPFWLERGGSTVSKTEKIQSSDDKKTEKIRLDYPKEILTSISGHYTSYLTSLAFESNLKKYGPYGSTGGTPFAFRKSDCKIVGFYGRRGSNFLSLGVYLSPFLEKSVPRKDGPWGDVVGKGVYQWNDGVYSGIHQIIVVYGGGAIGSINIQYDNNGSPFWPDHGENNGNKSNGNKIGKIQLDYPTEILTSISGCHDDAGIQSLTFESNLKKHGPFGIKKGKNFSVLTHDEKIVGFYGQSDEYLRSIGVYLSN